MQSGTTVIMDLLTLFGLFAVTAMLVCYALEDHSRWFILGFAAACALGSIYGFLQGAWPFGLVEATGDCSAAALVDEDAAHGIASRPPGVLERDGAFATTPAPKTLPAS
jgi:hypothetical protein